MRKILEIGTVTVQRAVCRRFFPCYDFIQIVSDVDKVQISLTKLMVLHDLPRSTVTNQIAFDQQDLHLTLEFECVMDCCCQVLVSRLETLDTFT